jgi:hypothetical protein
MFSLSCHTRELKVASPSLFFPDKSWHQYVPGGCQCAGVVDLLPVLAVLVSFINVYAVFLMTDKFLSPIL